MIVRIATEGQYDFPDASVDRLNELDNACVAAVESGDEAAFQASYDALLAFVRSEGSELPEDDLEGSDLILPPPDLTFDEAGTEFSGDGLLPD